MQNHTRIYLEAFGYDTADNTVFIPCEICEKKAVDIHHIIGRGKKGKDRIENLMGVCRDCHNDYGDKKEYMALLFKIHSKRLEIAGIDFYKEWIERQIKRYE